MKRTFIRFLGTAMAGLVGIFGKNEAWAGCPIRIVPEQTAVQVWLVTGCASNVINKVCYGKTGSESWVAATGDYAKYCWCKNVTSDYGVGDIACQYNTGDYKEAFDALTGSNGCDFNSAQITPNPPVYAGACANTTDACYYDSSSGCAKIFSSSGEALTSLANCCQPCYTGIGQITGLDVNGTTYAANWTVSNDGKTGIDTCAYSALSVSDKSGTFVAGNGGMYTCHARPETGI